MKQPLKSEIVSFNQAVPEVSKLLEVDGRELERVIGGSTECSSLSSCGTYQDPNCPSLQNCGTHAPGCTSDCRINIKVP